jgi:hypothetical protein
MSGRAKDVVDSCHSGRMIDAGTRRVAPTLLIRHDIIRVRRRLIQMSKLGDTSYMRTCHVRSAGIKKPVQRHVSCALLCLRRGRCDL